MTPTEAIETLERLSASGHGGGLTDIADVIRDLESDAAIGKKWRSNSALEEWFPITASELTHLRICHKKHTEAMKLVLLFHSGSPWTLDKLCQWTNGIGLLLQNENGRAPEDYNDCTTKNLCDAVRAALKT